MVAPIQEVTNSVGSNSSKLLFDTSTSSHKTPDTNCFKSFSSVRGNVVLADKSQIEYTSVGSVHLSSHLPNRDISVVLLCCVHFIPSLQKSLFK
jgi:hypothetical protein